MMHFFCGCLSGEQLGGGDQELKLESQENERGLSKGGAGRLKGSFQAELTHLDLSGTGGEDSYGTYSTEPYSPTVSSPQLTGLTQPAVISTTPFVKYDFADSRTIGTTLSSFTLETIFEECPECAEQDSDGSCANCAAAATCGGHLDFGSGATASPVAFTASTPRCRTPASSGADDLPPLHGAYDNGTDPRLFAILPSSTLSTVFEECDDEGCGEEGGVPTRSCLCHSVTEVAGCGGAGTAAAAAAAAADLLRGLSAPEACLPDGGADPTSQVPSHTPRQQPAVQYRGVWRVQDGAGVGAWPLAPQNRGSLAVWYF